MSNRLNTAKKVIRDNFSNGDCGLFNSKNVVGDVMTNIYKDDDIQIDICYYWSYFEVFGLTDAEFDKLREYYVSLRGRR